MEMSEKYNNKILRLLFVPIMLMPIWWILGLKFMIFHLFITLAFMMVLISTKGKIKWTVSHTFLLFYIFIYSISLVINLQQFGFTRVLGSFYNLSYWIIGLMLLIVIQNVAIDRNRLIYIAETMKNFGVLIGLLSTLTIGIGYVFDYQVIKFNTLLGNFIPFNESLLLEHMFVANLLDIDWLFGSATPRVNGFFTYPTAQAISISIIMLFAILYYKFSHVSKTRSFLEILIMMVALIFSASRTVLIGLFISTSIVYMINLPKDKKMVNFQIVKRILLVLFIIILSYFYLVEFVSLVLISREGSTNFRLSLYLDTIKIAMNNPVIGIGVKLINENYYASIGSHSTYFGALLKTGILGVAFLILFKLSIFLKWIGIKRYVKDKFYESAWFVLGVSFITFSIWMITDDIDAPIIASFIYFLICGLIIKLNAFMKTIATKEK